MDVVDVVEVVGVVDVFARVGGGVGGSCGDTDSPASSGAAFFFLCEYLTARSWARAASLQQGMPFSARYSLHNCIPMSL